jgi:hypothetical protein
VSSFDSKYSCYTRASARLLKGDVLTTRHDTLCNWYSVTDARPLHCKKLVGSISFQALFFTQDGPHSRYSVVVDDIAMCILIRIGVLPIHCIIQKQQAT